MMVNQVHTDFLNRFKTVQTQVENKQTNKQTNKKPLQVFKLCFKLSNTGFNKQTTQAFFKP